MRHVRAILYWAWRVTANCVWWGLGVWTVLAAYFTVSGPDWPAPLLTVGIAALYVGTLRESFRFHKWPAVAWPDKRLSTLALIVTAGVMIYFFGFVTPRQDQEWAPEHARKPTVRIEGDTVHVGNVRNFTWHSATDFTPGFYDRTYDLQALNSMY